MYLFKLVFLLCWRKLIAGSCIWQLYFYLRNLHTVFHSGCTYLHSEQQCTRFRLSHILAHNFCVLIGVRCYLQREVAKLFGVLFKICQFSVLFFRNCHLYNRNSQLACMFTSIQFSHSVMSNSLQPHGWQHTRPSCPSPTPRVYLNSCPSIK